MTEEQTNPPTLPSVNVGKRGIEVRSLDDMTTFARMVLKSGMAPKSMRDVSQVCVALQLGAEIGLSPMQSVQNVGVINGKPAIYGDAAAALVSSSGLLEARDEYWQAGGKRTESPGGNPDEWPDDLTYVVKLKRKGIEGESVGSFSVGDAKRAGLWKKSGPWSQYPSRMLTMRSRSWAYRAGFADVLGGMYFREEAMDIPTADAHVIESRSLADIAPGPTMLSDIAPADDVEVVLEGEPANG